MSYPAVVNRLDAGHDSERGDCGICSLACYLGVPYPEALRAATLVDRKNRGREGLTVRAVRQMAQAFGANLVRKREIDWDEDYGIVFTSDHCAVLRNKMMLDRDQAWPWESWLVYYRADAADCTLYVVKE